MGSSLSLVVFFSLYFVVWSWRTQQRTSVFQNDDEDEYEKCFSRLVCRFFLVEKKKKKKKDY